MTKMNKRIKPIIIIIVSRYIIQPLIHECVCIVGAPVSCDTVLERRIPKESSRDIHAAMLSHTVIHVCAIR